VFAITGELTTFGAFNPIIHRPTPDNPFSIVVLGAPDLALCLDHLIRAREAESVEHLAYHIWDTCESFHSLFQ
jgi:hypothetical protein